MTAGSFSEAALERLFRCYSAPRAADDDAPVVDAWRSMVVAATSAGTDLYVIEFNELLGHWYSEDDDAVLRVLGLTGLIELGVEAGYIDLSELHDDTQGAALRDALQKFDEERLSASLRSDVTLFRRLRQRYADNAYRVDTRDDAAFALFESYVGLTAAVRADLAARRFLAETRGVPVLRRLDMAILLSPRHFVDAFTTRRVGQLEAPEVAGALATLRHLDRLASLLAELDHTPELREGIVRHARWSHKASVIRERLQRWATAMREWADGESYSSGWDDYVRRVFTPLIDEQKRLGLEPEKEVETPPDSTSAPVPVPSTEAAARLAGEGRMGAARVLLRADANEHFESLWRAEGDEWISVAERLVQTCVALSDLGDVDSAAAYLAPIVDDIAERVGTPYQMYTDAVAVVARARRSEPPPAAEASPNVGSGEHRGAAGGATTEEKPRYRSRGAGE